MSPSDGHSSFPEPATERPEACLAVRLAFMAAGCGLACVAALMPCLARRLGLDAWDLSMAALALLSGACIGFRSVGDVGTVGTVTGSGRRLGVGRDWSGPLGSRKAVLAGGLGSALMLPMIAFSDSPAWLAAALFVFGLCAGALDAAMHATAEEVARSIRPPWRPGLRAIHVAVGVGGALMTSLLLAVGFEPPLAAALIAAPMAIAIVVAWPYVPEAPARGR